MRLAIFGLVSLLAFGQPAEESNLKFEVASIKPAADPASRGAVDIASDQVRIENWSLRNLIGMAYRQKTGERVEGPNWLDSARFDILAKPPVGFKGVAQLPDLVRILLADRFKLRVHTEPISISAFALVVAKGGFKLPESTSEKTGLIYRPGRIAGKKSSIAGVASFLPNSVRQQVLDETGLTGLYDIELIWTPSRLDDLESVGALMTALEEQLGLKLESRKIPGNNIVVDHAEREPTEN